MEGISSLFSTKTAQTTLGLGLEMKSGGNQAGAVYVFHRSGDIWEQQAKPDFAITHEPGHMFVTDLRDQDLQDLAP